MPDKPTIYRITHLWPNKQPGQGSTTAQIEEDQERSWTIRVCNQCGQIFDKDDEPIDPKPCYGHHPCRLIEVVPAPEKQDSTTVQIKPETDEPNALPSRFVSLQDYERLEREARS